MNADKKKPQQCRGFEELKINVRSVQRVLNAGEGGFELGTEALNHGDDGDGNTRSDQAIFDGGGARLVLHEPLHGHQHCRSSLLLYDWTNEWSNAVEYQSCKETRLKNQKQQLT